jgi:hypothetical protein
MTKVMVKQLEQALFLQDERRWTPLRDEAMKFGTALEAIAFCIRINRRDVRLLGQDESGKDLYLYPFGGDPATKVERKKLKQSMRVNRGLHRERRMTRARIETMMASQKEDGTQIPFKRTVVGDEYPGTLEDAKAHS